MTSYPCKLKIVLRLLTASVCFILPLHAQTSQTNMLLAYWALDSTAPPTPVHTTYGWNVVAHANPDECFYGLSDPTDSLNTIKNLNNYSFIGAYPNDLSPAALARCTSGTTRAGQPKINQAYVWGLTVNGSDVWFSTVANTLCLVLDGYYGAAPNATLTSDYVCDYKNNAFEDFKPARMFVYNATTQALTDLTPKVYPTDANLVAPMWTNYVYGLRSAGNYGGVVFFGGLNLTGSVVMFAFNSASKAYLGSYVFDGKNGHMGPYTNIRQWHVYNGQLYTGVATPTGGQILRWTGSASSPWSFAIVGNIGGDPAYFTLHSDNHIYVSTWPVNLNLTSTMSVWMSPGLHGYPAQLTTSDAPLWKSVWNLSQYEVEPSAVQGGGAIISYGGYLYFGTMHVPGTGLVAFNAIYPNAPKTSDAEEAAFLGSYRPIVIFRSKGAVNGNLPVQLLYGNLFLPKFNSSTNTWSLVLNNLMQFGIYGTAGFGNFFNNYTWAAEVYNNQLFFGTMDFSYLTNGALQGIPAFIQSRAQSSYGADLWYFTSTSKPAALIDGNGLGNITSYGIRNLVAGPDRMWVGMANPMNLRSDQTNNPGGWKLLQFK